MSHVGAVPSTPERREGLRACYWEGPSELPERRTSWLSSHGRGLGPRDALKKDSRGLSRGAASAKTRGFHTQLDEGPETP